MSTETSAESKVLRLARYLKEFVGLRSTTVYDVNKYESVLWFADMPQEPECQSPAWSDASEPGDPWLIVHKQQFPKPPAPPEIILPWIDQEAIKRASREMPKLRSTRLEPDLDAVTSSEEEPPLVERRVEDYPEITRAYEQFRPSWEAWSGEYERRSRIQSVYAELFRLHTKFKNKARLLSLSLAWGCSPGGALHQSLTPFIVTSLRPGWTFTSIPPRGLYA
jgi:hypothetical protein